MWYSGLMAYSSETIQQTSMWFYAAHGATSNNNILLSLSEEFDLCNKIRYAELEQRSLNSFVHYKVSED